MPTLIVSDLHLGNAHGRDVLRGEEAQRRLWEALEDVERLVLLGDIVELMGGRPREAMAVAEPVLRALGRCLGPDREVVVVPGNHDAPLLRRWAADRGERLGAADPVPLAVSPALRAIADWLAPARVRSSYPGVWLGERVWATHGHYLDRHLIPRSTVGLLRPPIGADRRLRRPADYERARRRARRSQSQSRSRRLLERPIGTVFGELIGAARAQVVPVLPQLAAGAGLAGMTAAGLDLQMRLAAVPAMARVAERLRIDADWVVFGHVHRRGPLRDEEAGRGPLRERRAGSRLVNTGSWLYEPLLLDGVRPAHPYWPGGAIRIGADGRPQSLGLLDELAFGPDPTVEPALPRVAGSLTS